MNLAPRPARGLALKTVSLEPALRFYSHGASRDQRSRRHARRVANACRPAIPAAQLPPADGPARARAAMGRQGRARLDQGEPPVVRLTSLKDLQAAPPAQATAGPGLGDLALRARGCQPRTPAGSTPGDRRVQSPAQLRGWKRGFARLLPAARAASTERCGTRSTDHLWLQGRQDLGLFGAF